MEHEDTKPTFSIYVQSKNSAGVRQYLGITHVEITGISGDRQNVVIDLEEGDSIMIASSGKRLVYDANKIDRE